MVIDIILIAVFLLCVLHGAKKGFAKTLVGLCSYIVSLIVGAMLFGKFYELIYTFEPAAKKLDFFKKNVAEKFAEYAASREGNLPAILKPTADELNLSAAEAISETAAKAASAVIFIISVIVLIKIFSRLITVIVKLPVLKQFNGLLGAAIGAVNGIIVCYIFGAVLLFLILNSGNQQILNELDSSVIGEYFYKNNFLLNMLIGLN